MRTPLERYITFHYDGAFRERRVQFIDANTAIVWNTPAQVVQATIKSALERGGKTASRNRPKRKTPAERSVRASGRGQLKLGQLTADERTRLFGEE